MYTNLNNENKSFYLFITAQQLICKKKPIGATQRRHLKGAGGCAPQGPEKNIQKYN